MSDLIQVLTHQTVDETSGVIYNAFLHDSGGVGLRAEHPNGEVEYITLNPSGGSDDGVPTVFVYIDTGETGTEEVVHLVNAVHHYVMFDEEEAWGE